jgi:hypothetical protein
LLTFVVLVSIISFIPILALSQVVASPINTNVCPSC